MKGSDNIVSVLYIKIDIVISNRYSFVVGWSVENILLYIKERIEDLNYFKDDFINIKILCK